MRFPFSEKAREQPSTVHLNNFRPEWTAFKCKSSLLRRVKRLVHPSIVQGIREASKWDFSWFLRCYLSLNLFPQCSHVKSRKESCKFERIVRIKSLNKKELNWIQKLTWLLRCVFKFPHSLKVFVQSMKGQTRFPLI